MAEPTYEQIFGANCVVALNTGEITIKKSDFTGVGYADNANLKPEPMFVSLLLLSANNLTETARLDDYENRNVTVTYSGQDLVEQGGNYYLRDVYSVIFYRASQRTPIDPTAY
jgi:hypothetical protein